MHRRALVRPLKLLLLSLLLRRRLGTSCTRHDIDDYGARRRPRETTEYSVAWIRLVNPNASPRRVRFPPTIRKKNMSEKKTPTHMSDTTLVDFEDFQKKN